MVNSSLLMFQDGSWTIESLSLVGLQPSKLEEHLLSLGAKSLGKSF